MTQFVVHFLNNMTKIEFVFVIVGLAVACMIIAEAIEQFMKHIPAIKYAMLSKEEKFLRKLES